MPSMRHSSANYPANNGERAFWTGQNTPTKSRVANMRRLGVLRQRNGFLVLANLFSTQRRSHIVLITDGQVAKGQAVRGKSLRAPCAETLRPRLAHIETRQTGFHRKPGNRVVSA